MKKLSSILILIFLSGNLSAQEPPKKVGSTDKSQPQEAHRKYKIFVENERNAKKVLETNEQLLALQASTRGEAQRGLLGDLLWQGYTSAFKQKTVNATSNLISLGINYISEALKSDREKWYRRAQQQCYYYQPLSTEAQIDDFYALPSTKGAMDPENLKFEGFGCKNYIEAVDTGKGVGVFYIYCKMRRDSVGLRHIINHSKFLVEIDSLVFYPKYCNLPNDSTGSVESRFSFEKRDNLNLQLKVRFYSSWMNQAMILANNQQLGEFTIKVKVDKEKLNADSLFIYDKNDPDYEKLISIDGDCYIVPRSYTGTIDGVNYQPTWGTGQYRVEMEVSEQCSIVDSYYQIRESGNGEAVAFADATPGKKKWDKSKWKVEWKAMNARRKGTSVLNNAWNCVVSAYKGNGWVATLTDPAATALYSWEIQKLTNWIDDIYKADLPTTQTNTATATGNAAMSTPTNSAGNKPQGEYPVAGGRP